MSIPKLLQYSGVKPRGFPSSFKRWEQMPQATNSAYTVNDLIRFTFKTDSFFDPYQTFIEVQIQFPQDTYTMPQNGTIATGVLAQRLQDVPVYMLDGPATSIISEFILYSNGKEVERVTEYDQVGNVLADLGVPPQARQNKSYEGYAHNQYFQNNSDFTLRTNTQMATGQAAAAVTNQIVYPYGGFFSKWQTMPALNFEDPNITGLTSGVMLTTLSVPSILRDGSDVEGTLNAPLLNTQVGKIWYKNFAREYVLRDGQWGIDAETTQNTLPGTLYSVDVVGGVNNLTPLVDGTDNYYHGRDKKRVAFNSASSINQFQYMCPGITVQKWNNGLPVADYRRGGQNYLSTAYELRDGLSTRTFYIPLISGVLGHLIPHDQWKLIPGKGCGEMTFEFRLNRYAFFSSGHRDNDTANTSASQSTPPSSQHPMNWVVKKMSIHFDLWDFPEDITQQIEQQIQSDGIVFTSQGFSLGPIQSIANTQAVRNVWNINNGILSLRTIYVWFILDDYSKYNYCRKHFRISHNLKSFQLKIGNEYIPTQAITGHAGQINGNAANDDDCWPFLNEVYRVTGEFLSTKNKTGIVPANFIANDRCYDPANKLHTRNQLGMYQEMRLSGKAIYTLDMLADPHDHSVLSGFDTTRVRPIEMLLDAYGGVGDQTRSSTMYVLLHHDLLVQFTSKGIETVGFG